MSKTKDSGNAIEESNALDTAKTPEPLDVGSSRSSASTISYPEEADDIGRVPTNKSVLYKDAEMRPPIFKSTIQEFVCCAACTLAPAAASMSSSSFATALSVTSEAFDVRGGSLTWCVNSVMLANGSCLLLMGGVADALGRRVSMIVGFFSFAIFSLISGFMNNFVLLCLFRGFMGACVACATPSAAGFLGSTYKDSKRKNMVMSMFALGAPVGGAFGFFISGVCLVALNWRAVQWFLSILYCVLGLLVLFFLPADDSKLNPEHAKKVLLGLDYIGSFLSFAAFALICFALTQVDATIRRWHTPYIIAMLVLGICLIPVFVLWEHFGTKNPIMQLSLFRNKQFTMCMVITCFSWIIFQGSITYFAVLYFEVIRGYSAIITACCMLPMPIFGCSVNVFAGLTMHKIPGRYLMSIGCLGFIGSSVIWSTMTIHRNYFLGPFWAFICAVTGSDLVYNVANRCALSSAEKRLQSRAAGLFNTIVQLSGSVGLGISSAIVTTRYPAYGTATQNDDIPALFRGIKHSYYSCIGFACASFFVSLFLKVGVVGTGPPKGPQPKTTTDIEKAQEPSKAITDTERGQEPATSN